MAGLTRELSIYAINVNSLIAHDRQFNLLKLLETYDPDVVLLSETKLNSSHRLSFEKYEFIRNDRPNAIMGGGTGILIKRTIEHRVIQILPSKDNAVLEASAISVKCTNNKTLNIVSAYATQSDNTFCEELDYLLKQIGVNKPSQYYIIDRSIILAI